MLVTLDVGRLAFMSRILVFLHDIVLGQYAGCRLQSLLHQRRKQKGGRLEEASVALESCLAVTSPLFPALLVEFTFTYK